MKTCIALLTVLAAGTAFAVEKPKSTTTVPETAEATPAAAPAADAKTAPKKEVRYRKSQQLQLDSQSVEGKLQRPEASLVTASEGVTDNGLLRLREDFLDKFTTFAGEEIQQ